MSQGGWPGWFLRVPFQPKPIYDSLYNPFKTIVFTAPQKMQSWHRNGKQIVVFGWYSSAGLELGSLSFSLRLQDLQIKRKTQKEKEYLSKFWGCGGLWRHACLFLVIRQTNLSRHTKWTDGFGAHWCISRWWNIKISLFSPHGLFKPYFGTNWICKNTFKYTREVQKTSLLFCSNVNVK